MMKNKLLLAPLLCLAAFGCNILAPFDVFNGEGSASGQQKIWVETMPTQCLSNPWQQEWIQSHGIDPAEYPHEREEEVLSLFFLKRNAKVFDYREEWVAEAVCAACTCPEGYLAFVKINQNDLPIFQEYGFKLAGANPDSLIPFDPEPHALDFGGVYAIDSSGTRLAGDTLKVTISHSGGCAVHEYAVYLNRVEDLTAYIFIHHEDQGDPCEAYLTRRLRANLQPLLVRDDFSRLVLLAPDGTLLTLR